MPTDYRRISPVLLLLLGCAGSRPMDLEGAEGQSPRPARAAEKSAPPASRPAPEGKAGAAKTVKSDAAKPETAKTETAKIGATKAAGTKAGGTTTAAAPPGEPPLSRKPAAAPRDGGQAEKPPAQTASEAVSALIRDLRNLRDPKGAEAAFLKIWEAPREWIPELIGHVEDETPSAVERIQMLIVDPEFVGQMKQFLANRVHGLGRMEVVEEVEKGDLRVVSQEYTKKSYGLTKNKKGYRLVMDKFGGFPVGVVVRAGLINRFHGGKYPNTSDDDPAPGKLIEWWKEYYRRAGPGLE